MNENKYSNSKDNRANNKYEENSSVEFEQADKDMFKTFEEYNEDYTFEAFEEVLIEEQEGSKWDNNDSCKWNILIHCSKNFTWKVSRDKARTCI